MRRQLGLAALLCGASALGGQAAAQTLDAEIAGQRRQLDEMQARLDQLEAEREDEDSALATEREGITLTFAGRVNQSLLYASQGDQDEAFIADNDGSGSRLEFLAESSFGEFTSGVEIVVSAEVNSTDEIDFGSTDDAADENGALGDFRQAHWFLESERFGYLSIGQGDTAAEDTAHVDLSGTDFAGAGSDVDDIVGGLTFLGDGGEELTEVDDFFDAQDGSRSLRLLYKTPEFNGFALKASAANDAQSLEDDDDPDNDGLQPAIGLEYAGSFGDYELEAGASWRREITEEADDDFFVASASVLAPSGISLTLAGSVGEFGAIDGIDDPTMVFAKLGYARDFFDFGETRFSFDIYRGRNAPDFAAPDGELPQATGYGLFAVQEVAQLNAELYIGGRIYELDDVYVDGEEVGVDNLTAVITGARVRF